jgi:integrase
LDAAFDPATGRRRQISRQGFRTKREAEAALTELLLAYEAPARPAQTASGPTVATFLEEWLPRVRFELRSSTWAAYRNAVVHLMSGLGATPLVLLAPVEVERFERRLLESGLATKTVANVHAVLHRALADGVRLGVLDRNVASLVSPPRVERRELKVWTVEELRTFLGSVDAHRLYAAFVMLATTGMRRGEALGLQRSDVDLAACSVSVRRSATVVGGKLEIGPPKTAAGRRLVVLDTTTAGILGEHLATRAGSVWVFPGKRAGPLNPASFSATFDRLVARSDVPRIRVHDLRHTYATIALRAGVHPAVVSERLGHSSIAITVDLYSHVVPSLQPEAAGAVAGLILGGADWPARGGRDGP